MLVGDSQLALKSALCRNSSVFPTEGFLRPGTQLRRFGRKLNALDDFFVDNFHANL